MIFQRRKARANLSMTIPVLGVPVINGLSLLNRLVLSLNFPIEKLVFVHNRDAGQPNDIIAKRLAEIQHKPPLNVENVFIHTFQSNLGCSAAWNTIILKHPSPWWLIANMDISFHSQTLQRIEMYVNRTLNNKVCVWPFSGYSLFGISVHSLNVVGTFDENFWPAYAEDCDYRTRVEQKIDQSVCTRTKKLHNIGVDHYGSSSYRLHPNSKLYRRVTLSGSGFNNFDYLIRKWGKNVCYGNYYGKHTGNQWTLDVERRIARGGSAECVACDMKNWSW